MQQRNKITLVKLSTIRSVLAGFFILLFAFGITPRLTLHNLVATHKDSRGKITATDHSTEQLSKAGFNCQCDNLVSESPFVTVVSPSSVTSQTAFADHKKAFVEEIHAAPQFCSTLRGPPVC
ncbi:MAG: hypothetical protein V4450_08580 [Bacteroidota bacterium]